MKLLNFSNSSLSWQLIGSLNNGMAFNLEHETNMELLTIMYINKYGIAYYHVHINTLATIAIAYLLYHFSNQILLIMCMM